MKTIRNSMAAAGLLAAVAMAQPPHLRYTVTDLGTLPNGNFSLAFDMNNAGWVAGASNLEPDGLIIHGAIWRGGKITDLGTLGGPNSGASGPNANGDAAVGSDTTLPDPNLEDFCAFGTNLQCRAAVWRNGGLTPLHNLPAGINSNPFGINNAGQVVGLAETDIPDLTCITPSQVRRFKGVIWEPNGEIQPPLEPLYKDTVSFALGLNDQGQAVGASGLCSDTVIPPFQTITAPHAVLWERDGSAIPLVNSLGGTRNIASAINNRGDVAGLAEIYAGGPVHAVLWLAGQPGTMHDLGVLPDDDVSVAPCCNTINDRRQVAGWSCPPDPMAPCRAFLWQDGNMYNLERPRSWLNTESNFRPGHQFQRPDRRLRHTEGFPIRGSRFSGDPET